MPGHRTVSEGAPIWTATLPLRTYSRRALKRRATSPPKRANKSVPELTKSATPGLMEGDTVMVEETVKTRPSSARKRRRLANGTGISPTDMFFDHVSASAPDRARRLSARLKEDSILQEAGYDKIFEPTEKRLKNEESREDDDDESDSKVHPSFLYDTAIEDVGPDEMSSDQSELNDSSPEVNDWLDSRSPVSSYKAPIKRFTLMTSAPIGRNFMAKSRFLTPNRPAGFKTIPHPRPDHCKDGRISDSFKATKRASDGFTREEARPSPFSKKDRKPRNSLAGRLDPLELTQKGQATQKMDGPTWPRGQKRSRTSTTAGLWNNRHYFGTSQFQVDSQDPVEILEKFDIKEPQQDPVSSRSRKKRLVSEILSEDTGEPVDLLVVSDGERDHEGDSPHGFDSGDVVFEPGDVDRQELMMNHHELDGDVDLITISHTDTPGTAPSEKQFSFWEDDTPVGQLPPKRMLNVPDCNGDPLALRPEPRLWLQEVTRVSKTPPKSRVAAQHSWSLGL